MCYRGVDYGATEARLLSIFFVWKKAAVSYYGYKVISRRRDRRRMNEVRLLGARDRFEPMQYFGASRKSNFSSLSISEFFVGTTYDVT